MAPADIPRLNEVDCQRQGAFFRVRDFDMHRGAVQAGAGTAGFQSRSGGESAGRRAAGRARADGIRDFRGFWWYSEVALSIILLAGAGLLLRSFWRVLQVRPGFNPSHLTTVQIWIPQPNNPDMDPYGPMEKRAAFLMEALPAGGDAAGGGRVSDCGQRHFADEFGAKLFAVFDSGARGGFRTQSGGGHRHCGYAVFPHHGSAFDGWAEFYRD